MPETLTPLPTIVDLLQRALARSPADETEVVWTESILATTSSRPRRPAVPERLHRTVAVRVLERGRLGSYRTGTVGAGELDDAIRQALAQSRTRPALPGVFHLPAPQPATRAVGGLHDPAVAALEVRGAASPGARGATSSPTAWALPRRPR
jgi:predicted Zn-dependent protease